MGRKKNDRLEFRFYELPEGESALTLLGEPWVGVYGRSDTCLHFHNLFEIGYCHYGRGKLRLGQRELPYEDAMISAIPANYPHGTYSDSVDSWEFLFFDPDALCREMFPDDPNRRTETLYTVSKQPNLMRIDEVPELGNTVWQILEECRERRPHFEEVVHNLLKVLLLELLRLQEGRGPELPWELPEEASSFQIIPALRYIDEHYAQDLRAADLARQCGLSEPHFRRLFSEYINMPPMDYLNLIRVRSACSLMSRKDCSMDQVALECGFASVSAFTRNFKKFLDVTPYQWKLGRGRHSSRTPEYRISVRKGWESVTR